MQLTALAMTGSSITPHRSDTSAEPNGTRRVGFALAVAVAVLTVVTFTMAVFTPPLSGPFCAQGCFQYPYSEAGARFPRDFLWMYSGTLLMLVLIGLLVCVHSFTPAVSQVYSLLSLVFGTAAGVIIAADYFVQISIVPPSLLAGEADGIALLSQYNPHGVFVVLEELGYLLIGVSLACLAPVFWRSSRAIAWISLAALLADVIALAVVTAVFGLRREYRFEVAVIAIDYLAMIAVATMLAVAWRPQKPRGG
jgi:hypothetical protein